MQPKTLVAALAATVGLTLLAAPPAQAAPGVTIKTIGSKTAPYKGKAQISPRVKASKGVEVLSKKLTVKAGKKTVAKNKTKARLKAGKYKVTTTVKYRASKTVTKNVLTVRRGQALRPFVRDGLPGYVTCWVTVFRSEYDFNMACDLAEATATRINLSSSDVLDWGTAPPPTGVNSAVEVAAVRSPANLYTPRTTVTKGRAKVAKRTQNLTIKAGKKAKKVKCATYKNFQKVKNGMDSAEVQELLGRGKVTYDSSPYKSREYKGCAEYSYVSVSFEDGFVFDKTYAAI